MAQPSTEVKEYFDFKSIGGCILSILLAGVAQPDGWLSNLISGLTAVALISTIAYNSVRTVKEIFERKNKTNDGTH